MSLESWKREFYPVSADFVEPANALAHCLRKWIGLRPGNLAKHGLKKIADSIMIQELGDEERTFHVHGASCALCVHYFENGCAGCPLAYHLGRPCDDGPASPYALFQRFDDPELMIRELEALDGTRRLECSESRCSSSMVG